MSKWTCTDCDWQGTDNQFLLALNPFDPNNNIIGCPLCKEVNTMQELCDEPGCHRLSSCGFNTEDGSYRRTCFDHSQFKQDKDKEKAEICTACNGSGHYDTDGSPPCSACNGTGRNQS